MTTETPNDAAADPSEGADELERAYQARALETVQTVVEALRGAGWDFVALSIAGVVERADGSNRCPGAGLYQASRRAIPGLPGQAQHLRTLAGHLEAEHSSLGIPSTAAGAWSHLVAGGPRRAAPAPRDIPDGPETCETCGATLAHVVGHSSTGQRFDGLVCLRCDDGGQA